MGYILKEDTVLNAKDLQELIEKRKFCYTDKVNVTNGIYGIRNIVNGKIYIGSAAQKTGGIKSRWYEHITSLNKNKHGNYHLQSAWNYYGIDKFGFFVVEIIDYDGSKDRRDYIRQREEYYFDKYNSLNREFGYNISQNAEGGGWGYTLEGIKNDRFKFTHLQFEEAINDLVNTDKGIKQINKETTVPAKLLSLICKREIFQEEFKDIVFKERKTSKQKADEDRAYLETQLDILKQRIKEGITLKNLSEEYKINKTIIKEVLVKNGIEIPQEFDYTNKVLGHKLKVYQYSLNGEFLKEYKGIMVAQEENGITNGKITECCKGNRKTAGGFRWSYEKHNSLPPLSIIEQIFEKPLSEKFRPIVQYDLNWNVVNYYTSYRKAMNNGFSSLEWYLKDQNRLINKPYKGFIFKYIDELPEEKVLEILKFKENKEDFYNGCKE